MNPFYLDQKIIIKLMDSAKLYCCLSDENSKKDTEQQILIKNQNIIF